MRVTIFSTREFEKEILNEAGKSHELTFLNECLYDDTVNLINLAEAVVAFVNDDLSAGVLKKLSEAGVKYIALRSAGFDHVDIKSAADLRIRVANVPAYSPHAVAEHAVALMLALNRKLILAHNHVAELNFSLNGLVGFDMNDKTVGIIGVGKIGGVVAKILNGFGCRLLGYDLKPNPEITEKYNLKYVDLNTLCMESDIISLHTSLTEQTRYLISPDLIARMKNGVMVINTSRGAVVNTQAILAALKSGKIGYFGLDVYEHEKGTFLQERAIDVLNDELLAQLLTCKNVLITGHQAFLTKTALKNIAETTFYNIDCWEQGKTSENELIAY